MELLLSVKKIGFIGFGNMGSAIGAAILENQSDSILIAEANPDLVGAYKNQHLNAQFCNVTELLSGADIVFLGIKPQGIEALAKEISVHINDGHTLVSMLAGVDTRTLCDLFNTSNIIRIMPNTPAMLGVGVTGIFYSQDVSKSRQIEVKQLCDYFGRTIELSDESLMHTITALSGSGPAFFYEFIDAFKQFGIQYGLDELTAVHAAIGTMLGAAKMLENEPNPKALVQRVASPNGTTEAGLKAMQEMGICEKVINVLNAAKNRSIELQEGQ